MSEMTSLHELMIHQLRDLYSAEKQLVQALPKMAKHAASDELQAALTAHLGETEEHVSRLERIFDLLDVSARGMKCKGMEGLIEEGKELLEEDIASDVRDAGIIAASQRIEHYEIAAYGTVSAYARRMGHDAVLALLESTLAEEKEADANLTSLAEGTVNALANDGMNGDDAESDDEANGSARAIPSPRSTKKSTRTTGNRSRAGKRS
jgi:ferritin-like metal-binding protein YciE